MSGFFPKGSEGCLGSLNPHTVPWAGFVGEETGPRMVKRVPEGEERQSQVFSAAHLPQDLSSDIS